MGMTEIHIVERDGRGDLFAVQGAVRRRRPFLSIRVIPRVIRASRWAMKAGLFSPAGRRVSMIRSNVLSITPLAR